ncbi:FxsC C-terminal domain containing protein [Actinobacteria bacterium OK074]|nr:FxsC C-terminal domain containing protein [Actinobacteria bacterium OK074]
MGVPLEREFYFFLSHARREDPEAEYAERFHDLEAEYVERFHADLLAALLALEADCAAQMSFGEVERLYDGGQWQQEIGRAVGRCRAFVALCSPAYVNSRYCGREWKVFEDRLDLYRTETDIDARALVAVLWQPMPSAPPPAMGRHLLVPDLPRPDREEYEEQGLYGLMRTDPAGPAYRAVVAAVARAVRKAAENYRLRAADRDLETVRGAFRGHRMAEPGERITGRVRVFVAAGTDTAPPTGRRSRQYYGRSPYDWTPYHPPAHPNAVYRAQQVIQNEECVAYMDMVDGDLVDKLDEALRNRETSVVLVDAWAARGEPYRGALVAFDQRNHPVTGVLVPCHASDEESHADELWQELSEIFPYNWMRRNDNFDPLFQVRVDRRHFADRLARMVRASQNRLSENVPPRLLPKGPSAGPLPGLSVLPQLPPEPPETPEHGAGPAVGPPPGPPPDAEGTDDDVY